VPRNRRGRPALDETDPSVNISIRVPSKQYDKMFAEASRQRTTIPALIRRVLDERELAKKAGEE
jgi:hypothetical protein